MGNNYCNCLKAKTNRNDSEVEVPSRDIETKEVILNKENEAPNQFQHQSIIFIQNNYNNAVSGASNDKNNITELTSIVKSLNSNIPKTKMNINMKKKESNPDNSNKNTNNLDINFNSETNRIKEKINTNSNNNTILKNLNFEQIKDNEKPNFLFNNRTNSICSNLHSVVSIQNNNNSNIEINYFTNSNNPNNYTDLDIANKSIRGGNPKQPKSKDLLSVKSNSNKEESFLSPNRYTSVKALEKLDRLDKQINLGSNKNNFQHTKSIRNIAHDLETAKEFNQEPQIILTFYGQSGCGKSSIVYKLCHNTIDPFHIPTIKVETFNKFFDHESIKYNINLVDTIGLAHLQPNTEELLRISDFIFYVVDLTEPKSFYNIKEQIENNCKLLNQSKNNGKTIILGNKCDLNKNKDLINVLKAFSNDNNYIFYEVSAKSNFNLNKILRFCVEDFSNNK